MKPYKLAARTEDTASTIIDVHGVAIGGDNLVVMAGPCAVESREQLMDTALILKRLGANVLRGGAFKPRTSPYAFQGLAEEGLKLLADTREATGMPIVTEVMDTKDLEMVAYYSDILQIGSRNMQNYSLLREVGLMDRPVLLKRGLSATIDEWLMAAEYILAGGNSKVILCERGIRTFETHTRNTLDISAIPAVKELSHLPVIVDPSHATGRWDMVIPLSRAAIAAGADGLLIEVHPNPEEALCDGNQSLTPNNFQRLLTEIDPIAKAVGRML